MTGPSLLEAVQPLQRAALNAQSVAEHYRRYDLPRGNQGLSELANELRSLAIQVITASGPLGIDLSAAAGDGSLNDHIGNLATVMDGLISAQASQDWITVADILEYDLEPAIRRWAVVVTNVARG